MTPGRAPLPLTVVADAPVSGRFLARPHRFAAVCRLHDGRIVEAHLPNPGRLTGTAGWGRPVLLDGPYPPDRRALLWTCVAIREPSAWVGTVTTRANDALPRFVAADLFPELGEVVALSREVKHGRSRFDFCLERRDAPPIWVECKSVTLARGRRGLFPDAVTTRGARHLAELSDLARRGTPAAVVLVAQRGDVDSVEAAREIDPAFADALAAARDAGVLVLAARLDVTPGGLVPDGRLEVRWA